MFLKNHTENMAFVFKTELKDVLVGEFMWK